MYSISNIESSIHGVVFAKMRDEDFKNYIIIYNEIKRLEELNTIKKIALKNSMDVVNYVKEITGKLNNKFKISHDEIHNVVLEYIVRAILLNQTFIENIKVYSKLLTHKQKEEVSKEINENEELQFLRILRNYTYHNTIPISTSVMTWDVLLEKYKDIKVVLYRDKLINNMRENKRDMKFIEKLEEKLDEKINLVNHFAEWIKEINFLYQMVIDFLAENLKENLIIFSEKFYNIFISTNGYVIDSHEDGTYDKYIIDKEIYKQLVKSSKMKV